MNRFKIGYPTLPIRYGLGALTLFLLYSVFPAQAWMPGFADAPSPFLVMTVEASLQMRGTALDEERNDQLWMEYTADLQQSLCRILIVKSTERPSDFSQPVIGIYLHDGIGALINHEESVVTIRQQNEADSGARLILTAGRTHRGHSLEEIFTASQDRMRLDEERGVRVLEIADPYFDHLVVIEFDDQNRAVHIVDGDETFNFTWAEPSGEFPHVLQVEYRLDGDGITILRNETVRDIHWRDNLPDSVFQYDTPSGYDTRDYRNQLQPPSVLPR